jgi:hypothetical protein
VPPPILNYSSRRDREPGGGPPRILSPQATFWLGVANPCLGGFALLYVMPDDWGLDVLILLALVPVQLVLGIVSTTRAASDAGTWLCFLSVLFGLGVTMFALYHAFVVTFGL